MKQLNLGGKEVIEMRKIIGGGSSNIGAGSGDVDPSWVIPDSKG